MNTLINQYKEDAVAYTTPERLVLMMFDGALRNLHLALRGLDSKEYGKFGSRIGKAQSIVSELINALNPEAGEIAKNLDRLYLFIIDRLLHANVNKNPQGIRDAVRVLEQIREGWTHVLHENKSEID